MLHLLYVLLATARSSLKPQRELALENLALRRQLAVVKRKTKRPKLTKIRTLIHRIASASPPMGGRASHSRWSADCIIATRDAQPDLKSRSHIKSGVSCAHCARLRRMPRSIRARRTVDNARKGPSSVRWVTFAIIAAHISRADNVLRNDSTDSEFLGIEPRNDGKSLVGVFTARRGDSVT